MRQPTTPADSPEDSDGDDETSWPDRELLELFEAEEEND